MASGNAGEIAVLLILFLILLNVAAVAVAVPFVVILIYSLAKSYHYRNNNTPRHEQVNPAHVPFILQRGEVALLGHTKSVFLSKCKVRQWRNSRAGAGLEYGYGRTRTLAGVFAWGSSGTGRSWTSSELVRIKGQAYLTDRRFVFLSSESVTETIPLSELASVSTSRRTVFISTENHGKIGKFQLRLNVVGPAQRVIVSRWSQTMVQDQEKLASLPQVSIASHRIRER